MVYLVTIPVHSLEELLQNPSLDLQPNNSPVARLAVDTESSHMLGAAGSFKTCHPAILTVITPTNTPPFSGNNIVAKRLFIRQPLPSDAASKPGSSSTSRGKRQRQAFDKELPGMLSEADCIHWMSALMIATYTFVDDSLAELGGQKQPSIEVPRLRTVQACLAIPQSQEPTSAVYLLEERIPGKFIKYILNNEARPNPSLRSPLAACIAEFLCFAQHVQYLMTGKRAFLSDFQGTLMCSQVIKCFS